jgi:hypothetical protein
MMPQSIPPVSFPSSTDALEVNMPAVPVVFSFANATTADGNRFAGSLAETLRDIDPDIRVERIREREDTQDFGASLAVVLGTAAATALAKGIAAWLARNSGAKLEILREGQVVMRAGHLDSADVPKLAQALRAAGL